MDEQKVCQGCNYKSRCQEVYEKLGKIHGQSVVLKVLAAFLLPIVVFIGCLAASDRILAEVIHSKGAQTVVGLLLALLATCICILITRLINKGFINNK